MARERLAAASFQESWLESADDAWLFLLCCAVADTPFVRTCIQSCTAGGPEPPVAGEDGLAVLETVSPRDDLILSRLVSV